MNNSEFAWYRELSNKVKWAVRTYNDEEIDYNHFMSIIMQRRSFVYEFEQRIKLTCDIIKKHKNERIIIFSERLIQLNNLSKKLTSEKIPFSTHSIRCQNELSDFLSHKTNILLTSKMIKEGFDDPSITTGIIMSTPLTERNHIQTIGRMVRQYPDKEANIYVLLAKGTTDEKLGTKSATFGNRYSLDTDNKIFIKRNGVRIYSKEQPQELLNLLKPKHSGRFWINPVNEVHTKINNEIILLGIWNGTLTFEE